ncbi:TPA: DNA cytosine methyltransferase [Bacillus cereus]|uniref:DNA cytosine methyltransferase n=1 Tax=Bacillus thuringiensis TaxID=1428 RepID=UPI000871FE4E|nr:DNA cytosine methyltransferase [Bacillus thuringiensis]HDR4914389.1 DNA cytosine methyltransferase [Bacillus cereus]OFC75047.1 C-5 cytosine-specific DNA methylase [Bacillus thuringiensis]OFC77681.1 C-5 cytosine-specific DNA methylase [Bacillus thuringiensis]HDR4919728.1 DNA cytosine methyltransferase [Bacillus cereus]HDX9617034.1 DNA cytosine methyltransferase [Bacillus thuringiensis]
MIFKKGELFCGPGGLSLGAKLATITGPDGEEYKVEHAWANDFHEDTCETFRHNICPENPDSVIHEDVRELDITKLDDINAFAFGFPCNDYSIVGESKGLDGDYGPLYSYGIKVLNHFQPDWFIAENVGGLESANEGQAFIQILKAMEEAGYNITPHKYRFEQYGLPQSRHRIIIVGIHKRHNKTFKVPKAPFKDTKDWKTSKQALEEPLIPENALNHEFTRHDKKVVRMLSEIKPGDNAWAPYLPKELQLNVKKTRMSNIYRRLHPDTPAYTVTGSGGGGTHMYHYDEPRALTNRERARLQTFPDWYEFKGGKESVRRQIGMAVPVDAAKVIVEAILKTFAGIEYETEPSRWEEELSEMLLTGKTKKKRTRKKKTKEMDVPEGQAELIFTEN